VADQELLARLAARPLRFGRRGFDVRAWQNLLRKKGFVLAADGVYGTKTLSATKVAQAWAGVTADGVVGPVTWKAVERKRRTRRPAPTGRNVLRPPGFRPKILDARHGRLGYPKHPQRRWERRPPGAIRAKLGHYTGGPASFLADARFHVRSDYLTKGGAPAIAYLGGVDKDGTLLIFNDVDDVCWHCDGGHNTDTAGFVFRGGAEGPNLAQRRTLAWLWRRLERGKFRPFRYEPVWPKLVLSTTHRHVRATSCPGEKGEAFYRKISPRFAVFL